jgi:hypothetical protein
MQTKSAFSGKFLNITEVFFCQEITAASAGQSMSLPVISTVTQQA